MIEQPPDQKLVVTDFHAVTDRMGDNPPTLLLITDVVHAETGHPWRQELLIDRDRWVALMQLLDFAAEQEGVGWKQ